MLNMFQYLAALPLKHAVNGIANACSSYASDGEPERHRASQDDDTPPPDVFCQFPTLSNSQLYIIVATNLDRSPAFG